MQKHGHIAYNKLEGKTPTIIFLSGFKSDMEGTKAVYLESVARELGHSYIRFDYFGHGKADGRFEDGTITQWKNDALTVIDELTTGEIILIGSSMGGWLSLLVAQLRPERIKAIIGIAAAPDFTEESMWAEFTPEQKQQLSTLGYVIIPNCYDDQAGYNITKELIEDGRNNLLLQAPINITCPVRLIQGMKDDDVPYKNALRIAEKITGDDVQIHYIKNGTHRLSEPDDLELLKNTLTSILKA